MQYLLIVVGIVALIEYWYITLPAVFCLFIPSIILHFKKERYFASEEFIARKKEMALGSNCCKWFSLGR